ncbi:MAG: hypothetical protein Q8Q69_02670 [Nitrosopumilaceae archaeon]|nr:hypothetical protein [Nitrosopumilaceae archaeon]
MNKFALFGTLIATLIAAGSIAPAFAQYMGSVGEGGETGASTLEETLKLARAKVDKAAENPSTGSGTPYLAADGVLGASAIAGAVFGGIAIAFFTKAKRGKYAAQGRG